MKHVLHIIREEDLSLAIAAMVGLEVSTASDDENDVEQDENLVLSVIVAVTARYVTSIIITNSCSVFKHVCFYYSII